MVADLRKLANDLETQEGPLALFMLVAPDAETSDSWNLIVSSHGLDRKSLGSAVRNVTDALRRNVRQSEWSQFARVTVLRTDDPIVRAMNSRFYAEQSVMNLQSFNVSGIDIARAVLLESKRVAA